jgi:AraC-like DNA-binding protein
VGWADPPYFSRRFRAVFGSSPRVYRQRHRHEKPEPLQHH